MIRLLVIGRPASGWAQRLQERAREGAAEVVAARLPAEAVRSLEATPPDAIVLVDDLGGPRVLAIVQALRSRPIGQLLPVLLICPREENAAVDDQLAEAGLHDWLSPQTSPADVWRVVARALDLPVEELCVAPASAHASPPAVPSAAPIRPLPPPVRHPPAPGEDPDIVVEAPPDPVFIPPVEPVERRDRASLFPLRPTVQSRQGQIDAEAIRKKLRDARHEDYYTLLELRRGADGLIVRQAYQQMVARYDHDAIDFELARRFFVELAEIRDALEDAWAVLGDPELREAYLHQTTR
jgi:CheY-like chemotaxis protein